MPPSFFSKLPEPGIISGLTSKLSIFRVAPVHEEKRPTFAFIRRIRDHPKLSPDALRSELEKERRYPVVVPKTGDTIVALVQEWANWWLEDAHTDTDVEKRLEGMVEEVTCGNVIWFATRGWQTRGNRKFNADFMVCVPLQSFVNSACPNA